MSRDTESESIMSQVALWGFMVLLGPVHFRGEMVGPTGATDWRQWAAALLGSVLWAGLILEVIARV